ncbi:MAG TPA: ATP-binding protein [Gaiellales bacterium]|nr:ATP-binding protein [Gaiellales bacterium]
MAVTQSDRPAAGRKPDTSLLRTLESSRATAPAVAAALVLLSTLVTALVTPAVPVEAAGVIYLVGVLGVSSIYGLWWGLATSVASALAYNFFFLPPAHTFVINSSSDWAALAAFVLTALVTSNLASRARSERDEAARRASEARLSESFATLVADADDLASVLPTLASQAARALGATDGVIHRGTPSPPERRGAVLPLVFNDRWMGELRMIETPQDALDTAAAERVARSLAGLIALGEERERRIHQQVQAEALSRSDELKTALLRAVSHDLRSPLMAISTAAGGLRYAGLDDEDRELLETITEQTGRMNRMVENLLDLSKLQAGAVSTRADWIDLRELVEASADELARRMPDAGAVELEFDGELPLVRGDAPQLQRVLVNLLENARKFSPKDQAVRVTVRRRGGRVDLSVADRGPGVAAEEADRIFEPFYRSPERRGVPGSGLGLAIARGLAEANTGTLAVEPREGGGSIFTLTLPVPAGRSR